MKNIDKKIQEVKELQAELDRRTEVENEAIKLISKCRFEEAEVLLKTLDNDTRKTECQGKDGERGIRRMKNIKKTAKKKIRKFENATYKLLATYEGIAYIHLLEVAQALYMQKKYDLVSNICDAAVWDIKGRY